MIEQNHNFEIETALLHFQSALDGAVINRYAGDWADPSQNLATRQASQKIKVNYVFGPKQRIIADLEGKTDTVKFPIVAICPTGMGRDDARLKNKNDTIKFRLKDGNYGNYHVIPWNINVSISIMTRFQEDMTQIISNFAVISNPYFIFSWREPKTGLDVRAEVYWDGQMAMEYPGASNDLPPNTPFRVMGTANFVIKTFLYRTDIENTAKICKIDTDVIVTKNFYCNYDSLVAHTNENGRDEYEILGKPQLRYVDKYYFKEGDSRDILIQGDGFALTDAIYLSGNSNLIYPLKDYNIDGFKFKGYLIDRFDILDSQNITFTLPPPSSFGFVDIIISNECGIGQLTRDVNRCSRIENPYKPSSPDYNTWRVQQFPYLNGLIVSSNLNDSVIVNCDDYILIYSDPNTEQNWLSACEASILIKPIQYDAISLDDVISYLSGTPLGTNSALWDDAYNNLVTYSALYLEQVDITDVQLASSDWDAAYDNLVTNSALYLERVDITDVQLASSDWDAAYDNLVTNSALYLIDTNDGDLNVNNFVYTNSAELLDIKSVVHNNSALWILSGIGEESDPIFTSWVQIYSANYESTFSTVLSNSSDWNYQGTDIKSLTANWQEAFNNLVSNSSDYLEQVDLSELQTNSANWNTSYENLVTNSAAYLVDANDGDLNVNSFVYTNSANILDINSVVQTNSALWILSGLSVETDPIFTLWASTYSANYQSTYNTVNINSSTNWNYQGTDIKALTANWQNTYVNFSSQSANNISVYNNVNSKSANWDSTYNTVNSYSATNWNYQGNDIKALTGNWQNTYVNFSSQSANNISVYNSLNSNSSNYDSVYNTVNTYSGINWNYQGLDIKALTGNWQNTYTDFSSQSANNISVYNNVNSKSANWESTYSTVQTNSATNWNYQGLDIKALTGNWQNTYTNFSSQSANNISVYNSFNSNSGNYDSVYNIVNTNSATNWNYQGLDIKSLTANWQDTYSTVGSYSATWGTGGSPQTLAFNESNAQLTISEGNTISLSSLSGNSGSSGVSYLSALNDVYIPSPANGQVLTYSSVLEKWTTGSPTSASNQTGYYGSFYDTTAQTLTGVNQAKRLDIADTFEANGVSLSSNKIVFNNIGTYEIIFSIQYKNTSADQHDIYIWFRKNGVDIPDSSSVFTIPARKSAGIPAHLIAVTPFIATLAASDFIEIYWHCNDTAVTVETFTTHSNPTIPDTPGVIITVKQVTNVQLVPTVGAYLPLSGGTVTGILSTTNVIYASGGDSDQWNSSYDTVNSYSATNWNYQGLDIKALTANYQSTFSTVNSNSASWAIDTNDGDLNVNNFVYTNSANILDINSVVQTNSALWILSGGSVDNETDPIFTSWASTYSANYQSTYNTVLSNSATWGTGGGVAQTLSFNESNAELSISSGNTVSLSSLSGGGNGGNGINIAGNLAYNRWQFTGVPPVSTFNITGATSEIEESYRVTIDAVIQDPVNFIVTADTITFFQAPPLSSNIVIIEQYNTSLTATVSSFTTPVTASGDFIILRVNNVDRAIRLWDF